MNKLISISMLLYLLFSGMAGAQARTQSVNLYAAERVILQNADQRTQLAAVREALREVLVRVSGDPSAADAGGAVAAALEAPNDVLAQFGFGASDALLPDAIGNPQPTYRLQMVFDEQRVRQALTQSGFPIWSAQRPSVLMLLAGPYDGRIDLIHEGTPTDGVAMAQLAGQRQGIPLFWPDWDIDDLALATADDLWVGNEGPMNALAARYQTEPVLAGYVGVQPDSGQWVGRWHFLYAGQKFTATFFGESQTSVIEQGVRLATDALADRYAVDLSAPVQTLTVDVLNVTNIANHGAVRRYLRGVNGVSAVTMERMRGDVATYQLALRAPPTQWLDILALEGRLQGLSDIQRADEVVALQFIWRE
ncbi:DUF2066 domain-containing protein [Salinispirillum marinum]|uniref:DUF2066 domain-containing protein n=2 Tax=Saccharospirillaceae TaxID=255527 RepID=A0ABV8BHL4_9GAMM